MHGMVRDAKKKINMMQEGICELQIMSAVLALTSLQTDTEISLSCVYVSMKKAT